MLITFEGIDGSGKTTQAKELLEYLKKRSIRAHLFREPGGTPLAERLREVILSIDMDAKSELFIFEAARADLVARRIKPLIREGETVILDRFTDSTLAYQGYGRGLDLSLIRALNEFSCGGIKPDITFLLDIEPSRALERLGEKTRFEESGFLEKVREGFLTIAKEEPHRVVVINSNAPKEEVFTHIIRTLKGRFF